MASEEDDALREMARHRGFRLVKSRRRKAGGDFGLFGLKDEAGKEEVFGFGESGLTASAEEIEAYLRQGMRATWSKSAGSVRKRKPAPPAPPSPPPPPPKPKLKKLKVPNLFDKLPAAKRAEAFTDLLERRGLRIERIVSHGQATADNAPMVQDRDEWVVLLQGAAGLRIEGYEEVTLRPGDHLLIEKGVTHWVTWTAKGEPSVWLAVHLD
jgi:mannose-6-phosphate isomerase-like protein (cupin superfamily)